MGETNNLVTTRIDKRSIRLKCLMIIISIILVIYFIVCAAMLRKHENVGIEVEESRVAFGLSILMGSIYFVILGVTIYSFFAGNGLKDFSYSSQMSTAGWTILMFITIGLILYNIYVLNKSVSDTTISRDLMAFSAVAIVICIFDVIVNVTTSHKEYRMVTHEKTERHIHGPMSDIDSDGSELVTVDDLLNKRRDRKFLGSFAGYRKTSKSMSREE